MTDTHIHGHTAGQPNLRRDAFVNTELAPCCSSEATALMRPEPAAWAARAVARAPGSPLASCMALECAAQGWRVVLAHSASIPALDAIFSSFSTSPDSSSPSYP